MGMVFVAVGCNSYIHTGRSDQMHAVSTKHLLYKNDENLSSCLVFDNSVPASNIKHTS
jgi:hypothetical protein